MFDYNEAYDRLEALGEARADDSNVWDDEYWDNLLVDLYPREAFNEITDNLLMGGGPWGRPQNLPGVITAVLDIVPSGPYLYDMEIREVTMHDDYEQPLDGVDELARWVNERRQHGVVLVKCAAGLNRSGVVVARALMLGPEQLSAREAIDLIREKRDPLALFNRYFEEWLLSHDKDPLQGRQARCTCFKLVPSSRDLAFFEYRGPGSRYAEHECAECHYFDVAHDPEEMKGRKTVVEQGRCTGFKPMPQGKEFDSWYCGHAGWD